MMGIVEDAREILRGTTYGKSSQAIANEIGAEPRRVSAKLSHDDDFVGLGGRRGRKMFILKRNFTEEMEVWVE